MAGMIPAADVYQGRNLVAHILRTPSGASLNFLPDAILENNRLSTHLPYSDHPIETPDLHPFFLNLLPEGARLTLLLEAAKSRDDSVSLLIKTGWDTIGDVSVHPHGLPPALPGPLVAEKNLNQVSFWDLFSQSAGDPADSAVPGVQEKISGSTVAFQIQNRDVPSRILKLNPRRFPLLVQNENFFLKMAADCGLRVNKARLVSDSLGEPGLLVTRFDRVRKGKEVFKLHQEDACQLLNTVPGHKYEATMRAVAENILLWSSAPKVEVLRLLQLYAFSYIIGNGDLHAKNISLLWSDTVTLSPAYDLLSTLPYKQLDRHMALKLDGKDDSFKAGDFANFGMRFGVAETAVTKMIERLCGRASSWIEKFRQIGFDEKATESLQAEAASRISKLQR
jgi:serine/threonine-protein kinase HipA